MYSFKIPGRAFSRFIEKKGSTGSNVNTVIIDRLMGFFWLGVFPFVVLTLKAQDEIQIAGLFNLGSSGIWLIVFFLTLLILVVNYFNAPRPSNLIVYPQIRDLVWSKGMVAGSALTWIIYLLGYEYAFRGILLFACLASMPAETAVIINVLIYSLFHFQKGAKEAVGSIPFGILICYLVIESHSIWPAVFLHIVLALSNEWFSIYFNPKISIKTSQA
ncbi:MAG: CPBP family intramembrane metalloprotease [Saprospiraceae bacterium]|nr:CPBP family intramembrane metalloprotease [Saprospiraceae bacterium]